ncbi:hypothetical protein SBOR_3148 [Sclerotinia borealis F-4128]|uniref:C2H2-type domain-containing protein n=1 Tax=Sclerotinia borealis (strain F-4128) TaxID=1432307 RepID=W9CKP5_SCLBF|nr:hypothetical protein SBOR_3148 [Sclerotinia borealis F-4128]
MEPTIEQPPPPKNQDATSNRYPSMSYNEYEQHHQNQKLHYPYLMPQQQQQLGGVVSFPSQPLCDNQSWSLYAPEMGHEMHPSRVYDTYSMLPVNSSSQPSQLNPYLQTIGLSPHSATQQNMQNMGQGYSNSRAEIHSIPNYTGWLSRKRQRVNELNGFNGLNTRPTIVQEAHQVNPDATSECCSSCASGSMCSESDCTRDYVVATVACTSPECEQPVCTSPKCDPPIYTEPCIGDSSLGRQASVVEGSHFSEKIFSCCVSPVSRGAASQASILQLDAPGFPTYQAPHQMSHASAPTTPSVAMNMETPHLDSTVFQTPGLHMHQPTNDTADSSLSGTGMRFGDGLEMFSCNWLDCGQPMHDQNEWHKHFHQKHIDPQFVFNCPIPSGSCQNPLDSNPLDHLQMNHGFNLDENINGFSCPAPECLPGEMYCDPSMFHNHLDQMHATPLQGELQCQIDSCNTLYQDSNQFFSHLNHHHNLPIPMTPIEEINLSKIPIQAEVEAKESAKEEFAPTARTEVPEADNHLSCKWLVKNHICARVFTSEDDLQSHVKDAHLPALNKISGYFCQWQGCSRKQKMGSRDGFSQRGKLERHMASHTGFKECTCDYPGCGKTFAAAQSLKQHYRLHTGEKPWKCKYCPKSFPQQSACTVHERIHTLEKPLVCSICGKTFSESSNLAKHRRTHGERGHYECPECPRTFHRLDQLKRHGAVHDRRNERAAGGVESASGGDDGDEGKSEVTDSVATRSVFDGVSMRGDEDK